MKLYEVPRNTRIVLDEEEGRGEEYNFHHIDGMYSYCTDDNKNVVHFAAWTEVKIKEKANEQAT